MQAGADPYAVLGVARGADEAQIHAAYRDAVRRTHPDAGGSAAAFEAVQEAYETLRDPARRRTWDATATPPPRPPRARPAGAATGSASSRMEDLLAESRRLEDEARRLAGMAPRYGATGSPVMRPATVWPRSCATPESSCATWPAREPASFAGAFAACSETAIAGLTAIAVSASGDGRRPR